MQSFAILIALMLIIVLITIAMAASIYPQFRSGDITGTGLLRELQSM
jgi:hypothetical protein